jgi:hypothetical protein
MCLETFTTKEVGRPDTCDHIFCAPCLCEWAKYKYTCPLDQRTFNTIIMERHPRIEDIIIVPVKPSMFQRMLGLTWCIAKLCFLVIIFFYIWILYRILCTLMYGSALGQVLSSTVSDTQETKVSLIKIKLQILS